jgi:hypothetical protein
VRRHPALRKLASKGAEQEQPAYKVIEDDLAGTDFFAHALLDGRLVVALNKAHPFYKKVFRPIAESDTPRDRQLKTSLELLLLAAGRASASLGAKSSAKVLEVFLKEWSNTLAAFLNE